MSSFFGSQWLRELKMGEIPVGISACNPFFCNFHGSVSKNNVKKCIFMDGSTQRCYLRMSDFVACENSFNSMCDCDHLYFLLYYYMV